MGNGYKVYVKVFLYIFFFVKEKLLLLSVEGEEEDE